MAPLPNPKKPKVSKVPKAPPDNGYEDIHIGPRANFVNKQPLPNILDTMDYSPQSIKYYEDNRARQPGFKGRKGNVGPRNFKKSDVLFEVYINNMLAQPNTLALNAISNTLTAIGAPVDTAAKAMLTAFSKPENRVYTSEVVADIQGLIQGILLASKFAASRSKNFLTGQGESIMDAAKRMRIDKELFATDKLDFIHRSTSSRAMDMDPEGLVGKMADGISGIINLPGTALNATDLTFKIIHATRMRYRWVAHQVATGAYKSSEDAWRAAVVDPKLGARAAREAEYYTYMGRPNMPMLSWVNDTDMEMLPGLRWVIPFKRSIANILEQGFERTPLALASPTLRARLMHKDPGIRATAQSRLLAGMGITTALAYTLNEHLVGSAPRDSKNKALFEKTYGPEESIVWGDQHLKTNTFGWAGPLLNIVANYKQWDTARTDTLLASDVGKYDNPGDKLLKEFSDRTIPVVEALGSNFWARNIMELTDVVGRSHQQNSAEPFLRYAEKMAGTTVPIMGSGVYRMWMESEDPYKRKMGNVGDFLRSRNLNARKNLPMYYTWDGEPMHTNNYRLPGQSIPTWAYDPKDEMSAWLNEIGFEAPKVADYVRGAGKVGKIGPKVPLTGEELHGRNRAYAEGIPAAGIAPIRAVLAPYMQDPEMRATKPEGQKVIVDIALAKYAETLTGTIKQSPGIRKRITQAEAAYTQATVDQFGKQTSTEMER